MTAVALIYNSSGDNAVTAVPALRAFEAIGPSPLKKRVVTLLLGAKLLNKLRQADTLLELNLISSHDAILYEFSGYHYQVLGGSLAEPQG